jgi:hypothetical protein
MMAMITGADHTHRVFTVQADMWGLLLTDEYFHTYATVDVCWTTWTEDGPIIALPANASATFWTIGLCLVKGDEIASGQH